MLNGTPKDNGTVDLGTDLGPMIMKLHKLIEEHIGMIPLKVNGVETNVELSELRGPSGSLALHLAADTYEARVVYAAAVRRSMERRKTAKF